VSKAHPYQTDTPIPPASTTIIPEQPNPEQSVYVGGRWDPLTDTWTGGHWERPSHGGLCRSTVPEHRCPAVIGLHEHWNGDYYMACTLAGHCPMPSCHPCDEDGIEPTRYREVAVAEWFADGHVFTV
jgi:hypothetical protein